MANANKKRNMTKIFLFLLACSVARVASRLILAIIIDVGGK